MTTLAEHMIVAGAENRPPMLDKTMYNSWQSCMLLYIKGKKNGRMMLESIKNEPLVYPTIEENGQIRNKKYAELTEQEKLQDECDDRVKLLMQGTELSYQERECKLYNKFDKFTSVKGESLYEYYLRFAQLINDMHTIGMTMQQVQLYAYMSQHEGLENEAQMLRERYLDPLTLVANSQTQSNSAQYPQQLSSIPKTAHSSQPYLSTYEIFVGMGTKRNATSSKGNNVTGQARVVKCYNCWGEGHMAGQCTQPKRPRNSTWFKKKMLLVQAQESGQELDEKQLAFLADPEVADSQDTQTTIPHNDAFQIDGLDV
ncbi:integrase, catalytic region, zinc finger, CCHC-type containing protein [Tanacetum coccineum]